MVLFFLFLLFAISRIMMSIAVDPGHSLSQVYQDVAHLFMGGLSVLWWKERYRWTEIVFKHRVTRILDYLVNQPFSWLVFWWLCTVEVSVAACSRGYAYIAWFVIIMMCAYSYFAFLKLLDDTFCEIQSNLYEDW